MLLPVTSPQMVLDPKCLALTSSSHWCCTAKQCSQFLYNGWVGTANVYMCCLMSSLFFRLTKTKAKESKFMVSSAYKDIGDRSDTNFRLQEYPKWNVSSAHVSSTTYIQCVNSALMEILMLYLQLHSLTVSISMFNSTQGCRMYGFGETQVPAVHFYALIYHISCWTFMFVWNQGNTRCWQTRNITMQLLAHSSESEAPSVRKSSR